jgi:ABC-2 type transport system ATP-binding protein
VGPGEQKPPVYAIECKNLTRKFGTLTAVDSLNLSIRKGELFGFLGPNGAGKTTTIKMLTTLLSPTSGDAKVAGYDIRGDAPLVRARIGVVPQEFAMFGELTAMENLWYIGELYGMKKEMLERKADELLTTVGLHAQKNVRAGSFSGGMKQRLSIAAGILHTPEILYMDEPTTGLDPQSRIAIRELTQTLNRSGITVVYTTHDMEEADKLCQRIVIMDKGEIKAEGSPHELKERYGGGHRIEIELKSYDQQLLSELKALVSATSISVQDGVIEMKVPTVGGGVLHRISGLLSKRKIDVMELRSKEPSLEEVFINLTSKEVRD